MSPKVWSALVVFFLVQNASGGLNELIKQNVKDATTSSSQLGVEKQRVVPQLWIHVRNEEQKRAVLDNLSWFKSIEVGRVTVDIRPIQLVTNGPRDTQLRYFKRQDRDQAQQLLAEIRKVFPQSRLQDLSAQFVSAAWMKSGHYELWLAADVGKIASPAR